MATTFDQLRAVYVNCTLKPSPEMSHTRGLMDVSAGIMRDQGVAVDERGTSHGGQAHGAGPRGTQRISLSLGARR